MVRGSIIGEKDKGFTRNFRMMAGGLKVKVKEFGDDDGVEHRFAAGGS